MSTSEVVRGSGWRFAAAEIAMVLRRRRTIAMLAALTAVPLVIGLSLRFWGDDDPAEGGPGGGPAGGGSPAGGGQGANAGDFIDRVTGNGLFLGFAALMLVTFFLFPLTMAVISGDSVAGEASHGTLRYLVTAPMERGRLLVAKYAGIAAYALVAALLVAVTGMVVGAILFPVGPVTLLSGAEIGYGETFTRALLTALYATVLMCGLGAIGLFVSTLTEVPIAAMATVAALPVIVQILGSLPALEAIRPWLFTDTWMAYPDLLREPIEWSTITRGVLTQLGYGAVFGSLAWASLTSRDITS